MLNVTDVLASFKLRKTGIRFTNAESEAGLPAKKDKLTHPYDYDPFVLWQVFDPYLNVEEFGTIWSDRLYRWDPEKHNRLCIKHFGNIGQFWEDRNPGLIELFLQDYLDSKQVRLTIIIEHCNPISGYPYCEFKYVKVKT